MHQFCFYKLECEYANLQGGAAYSQRTRRGRVHAEVSVHHPAGPRREDLSGSLCVVAAEAFGSEQKLEHYLKNYIEINIRIKILLALLIAVQ